MSARTWGHGYAVVHATSTDFETEFICIPQSLERSGTADGGPVLYRAPFITPVWKAGELPGIKREVTEGNPQFSIG